MKILDKRGFTLIELLVTLSLISIILPTLYGVLISGIQTYQKIQTEQQLRDDADYTSSRILNEVYAITFDKVQYCDNKTDSSCIELLKTQKTSYINKDFSNENKIVSVEKENIAAITLSKIEIRTIEKNGKDVSVFFINESPIDVTSNFKNSTITFNEEESFGMVYFNFVVNDLSQNHQIELTSNFSYSKGSDMNDN